MAEGAEWNQTVTFGDWNNDPVFIATGFNLFPEGDAAIGSVTFKKLWSRATFAYSISNGNFSGGNFTVDPNLSGGLAEDANKKIWFTPLANSEGFGCNNVLLNDSIYLIYDFDVSVGDSIQSLYYPSVVTSIDSVQLLTGESRKRYWLTNSRNSEVWIEGVGSSRGLLSSQDVLFECISNRCCYKNDDAVVYSGNYDSLIIVDGHSFLLPVQDVPVPDFTCEAFPSPTQELFVINFHAPDI